MKTKSFEYEERREFWHSRAAEVRYWMARPLGRSDWQGMIFEDTLQHTGDQSLLFWQAVKELKEALNAPIP